MSEYARHSRWLTLRHTRALFATNARLDIQEGHGHRPDDFQIDGLIGRGGLGDGEGWKAHPGTPPALVLRAHDECIGRAGLQPRARVIDVSVSRHDLHG